MKTLLILRHGKSSWKFPDLPDHDRPLNSRGKRDAPLIGRKLAEEGMVPDVVISSSATRAHATAKKAAKASGYRGEIVVESSMGEDIQHISIYYEINLISTKKCY
jgi:phosphohistidine phosphatase